ncbi:STAG domain [Teratosphaeria destructans]|uniref:STAG domain n=1 Tax=Teratosphaeria destructans TaxID=418781 RepID=A0A9W7SQP0_9PEZI|nr:STAG domain [Teratosphaeria destructans]
MSTNKRASGRVRKQPELYSANFPSTTTKRKRNDDDDGEIDADVDHEMADEVSEESEEDADDDEPAAEELRERKKQSRKSKSLAPKKQPAPKKTKVNGASLPFRNATGGAKKRAAPKKARAVNMDEAAAVGGLYAEVFASGETLENVAGAWIQRFEEHESNALAEVVNFVLKCAGCDVQVTDHDIEDPDAVTSRLDDIRAEYQATEPTDYPLIAKGKVATSVRQGLTGFFNALVKALAVKGTFYENPVLMENVQVWISTMSSAPNRSFRHTATVASLCITSALCEIAHDNADAIADHQRHAEAERKKTRTNQGRVKHIEGQAKEAMAKQEFIEPQLDDWFSVVFVHRYRDVNPSIRLDCIEALGDWIVTMPDIFFDGNHLRYMGWVLSDTSAATRGEVIRQLRRLYKEKDKIGGLKTFTEKFKPRMVEIAITDADTGVRVAGVELLDLLEENSLLEPDDIDAAGRLIYDTDAKVRKAIGPFFAKNVASTCNDKIDDLGGAESLEEALPEVGDGNYETPRIEWLKLKTLAELLEFHDKDDGLPSQIERSTIDGVLALNVVKGESRFTRAAEVLIEHIEEVKEWELLAGYLLFDHSAGSVNGVSNDTLSMLKHECRLEESQEAILLEVLQSSVKHALLDVSERLKAPKNKLTRRQKEDLEEEQEEAARQLVAMIPKLLKKFGSEPATAAAVLRIEAILGLEALKHLRQDSNTYVALLDDVRKQFMSHGTDDVLAPASNAILHAKSYGELDDLAEEKVSALWDDVVSNLLELLEPAKVPVRGATTTEELTAVSNNLLRIVRLSAVSDPVPHLENSGANEADEVEYQGAIDFIIALVARALPVEGAVLDAQDGALEDEIAARAASAALFYCRWKLKYIVTAATTASSTGVSENELDVLTSRRDAYVENMQAVLEQRKSGDDVSVNMAGCIVDYFTNALILSQIEAQPGIADNFSMLGTGMNEELEKLALQVFAAAEKKFAQLTGKRLEQEIGDGADDEDADEMNDDPMSDPESDDEEDEPSQTQTQASQQRRHDKQLKALLAEQSLCAFTGKIVHAYLGGILPNEAQVRKRLERNKSRLGQNFKEVLNYLDLNAMAKKQKGKSKKKAPAKKAEKVNPKSNAIVAEDDLDDEIEDEEVVREKELAAEAEMEHEEPEASGAINGAEEEEAESVLGD